MNEHALAWRLDRLFSGSVKALLGEVNVPGRFDRRRWFHARSSAAPALPHPSPFHQLSRDMSQRVCSHVPALHCGGGSVIHRVSRYGYCPDKMSPGWCDYALAHQQDTKKPAGVVIMYCRHYGHCLDNERISLGTHPP